MKKDRLFIGLALVALLALPRPAAAQGPYSHVLKTFVQGATTPVQTTTAPAAAATCNQAPTPLTQVSANVVNPTAIEYDDPQHSGAVCRVPLTAFLGGLPTGLPNGTYISTLAFKDDVLQITSADSAASNPFDQRAAPGAPGHVRVIGGK